jgi:hypothetical protein
MTGIPTKIAAGVSLVALGSVAGYSIGSGPAGEQHAVAAAKRQPVDVRTQTIRRTVRIVKHQRPRREPPAPAPAPAVAAVPAARSTPVTPQAAPPQPMNSTPVRTRTSGAGSSGGEREHGDEHEGGEREGGDD